jgi:small subunit ribosomal protein S9
MSSLNLPSTSTITGLSTVNPAQEEKSGPIQRKQREAVEAKNGWWWGTGRRKRAVARVRLKPAQGEAKLQVQTGKETFKTFDQYFAEQRDRNNCVSPLVVCNVVGKFDIIVRCNGGGYMGQAEAIRLGVARALRDYDPSLEDALRNNRFLTRDAREVERKKYGQAGARRRFQFSKR